MKRVLLGAIAALLSFPSTCTAATWVPVSSINGEAYYLDKDSITKTGVTVSYWTMLVFPPSNTTRVAVVKLQSSVNCRTKTSLGQRIIFYKQDGQVLLDQDLKDGDEAIRSYSVVPGTSGEKMFRYICRN